MKLLLDMNIPPSWAIALQSAGHDAVHALGQGALMSVDLRRLRVRLLPLERR